MKKYTEQSEVNNQVFLQGSISNDLELIRTKGGNSLCSFSLATDDTYQDSDGKTVKQTDWHQVKAWGKVAHVVSKNFAKGSMVKIKGKLKTSTYQKDGVKMYATSVDLLQIKGLDD